MNQFPRRVFLDQIIVREIPLSESLNETELTTAVFDHAKVQIRNRKGVVVAAGTAFPLSGVWVDMPVQVGQTVHFEDTSMYSEVFEKPIDEFKKPEHRYWLMRVQDLKGIDL